MVDWTEEMKKEVTRLWSEEKHPSAKIAASISKKFGVEVTKNSIIGLVHRMGLPGRPSPINNSSDYPQARKSDRNRAPIRRAPKTTLPPLSEGATVGIVKSKQQPELPIPTPIVRVDRKLGRRTCLWPLWGMGKPTHKYCGDRALDGHSYCGMHCDMAYKKAA